MITRVFFALIGIILVFYVYNKVKKRLFSEKESMVWMIGAIVIFILSLFPGIIDLLSSALHIAYPPSLLFLITMIFVMVLLLRQNQQMSVMSNSLKELVQKVALLEQEVVERGKDD